MKKLLIIEIIAAVLFVSFLFVSVGILTNGIRSMKTGNQHVEKKKGSQDTLRMQIGDLQGEFSPLSYQGEAEENLLSLCFENLLSRDETGRVTGMGEQTWKTGDRKFAHITSRKEQDGSTCVTLSVNPNKRTPAGEKITARDVIFNYYLRLDASNGLGECFSGIEIAGAKAYTYGSNDIAKRKKEIDKMLLSPSQGLKKRIKEEIIQPELQREYRWVQELYQDDKYQFITSKYTQPKDLFAYYYAYQTTYRSEKRTETQVMKDITAQYGANYIALGKVTEEDYSGQVRGMALGEILKQKGKDRVSQITGIRMVDEQTVEIHVLSGENVIEKLCDFWILPISVYGKEENYDGKTSFGFRKGEASRIVSLAGQKFLGTGAYYLETKKQDRLLLKKNPNYQKKVGISKLEISRKPYEKPEELVNDLLVGKLDMAVVREEEALDKLLNNRGTGAVYRIKKIKMQSDNMEESVLYRTSYVNATTLPRKKQTIRGIFSEFFQVKINTTSLVE